MDLNELASDLFGSKRAESSTQPSTVSVMYGIATSDSADGLVSVWLSDNALSPTDAQAQWETVDSYDADAYEGMDESTSIEIPTEVTCLKDDVVRVQLMGAGAAKNPTVVGVVGRGDEQNQRISEVEDAADVARANNQHFWTDTNGAHVTDEEQDDWVAEYKKSGHGTLPNPTDAKPWHNILLNSVGILLRRGLLTLVSITKNAVSFFDGTGTVTASFGPSGAQIGPENGRHAILDSNGLSVVNADGTKAPITGELSGYDIKDSTIVGSKFVDGTIEGSKIASSTITSTQISDSSITGSKIDASTFADGQISGSKINASTFTDGQISGSKIANSTITATQIADSTITGSKIADSSITGGKIQGSTLTDIPFAAITDAEIEVAAIADAEIASAHISYAQVDDLDAHYADIDLANVNTAWLQNGLIKDASISDAKIIGVSANKLTAGTIDAAEINVMNLRADNLKVSRVNGQPVLGGYSLVDPSGAGYDSKNPKTQGWYELTANGYVLTDDTEVVSGKAYYTTSTSVELYDQDYIDGLADDLSDRIDGAIETFTSSTVPTPNNYPASDWTTDDIRATHVGDVCYVLNEASDSDGWCYRYAYDNTTHQYGWVLIKDSDVTKALYELTDPNGELKTFETQTSTWKTATDNEITSIKSSQTSLETRTGNLETNKVDVSTFNSVSQKVDENSSTISTLSQTVSQKADSSTVTTLSNTVNTVKQTADTNKTSITNLTQTVADNKTAIETRASTIEQNLSGITTRVSATESTLTAVTSGYPNCWRIDRYTRNARVNANTVVPVPSDFLEANFIETLYRAEADMGTNLNVGDLYLGKFTTYIHATSNTSITCDFLHDDSAAFYLNDEFIKSATNTTTVSVTFTLVAGWNKLRFLLNEQSGADYARFSTRISTWANVDKQVADLDEYEGTIQESRLTSAETSITQNAEAIALRATKTEAYQLSQPNLSPFFSINRTDGTYWHTIGQTVTDPDTRSSISWSNSEGLHAYSDLEGEWAHFTLDARSSAGNTGGNNYFNVFVKLGKLNVEEGKTYTWLMEVRNANITGGVLRVRPSVGNATLDKLSDVGTSKTFSGDGAAYAVVTAKTDFSSVTQDSRGYLYVTSGAYAEFDLRLSLYEGEYAGPYKPYSGTQLYASQAELKVANDAISTKVEKDGVISSINQSAETVKIQASKVEIDGTAVFTAISSDVNSAITSKGYATTTQVATAKSEAISAAASDATSKANAAKSSAISTAAADATAKANAVQTNLDNLQVGGRNLLPYSKPSADNMPKVSTANATNTFVTEDGFDCYKGTGAGTSFAFYASNGKLIVPLEASTQYIYSAWVKLTTTTSATSVPLSFSSLGHFTVRNENSTKTDKTHEDVAAERVYSPSTVTIGQWTKITLTFTTNELAGSHFGVYSKYNYGTDYTLFIRDMKLEKGNKATDWTPAPEDVAADSVKRTQRIYYRKEVTGTPAAPGSWVVKNNDGSDAWTQKHISISSADKYIYTCEQYEMADGTLGNTSILLDDTITVIDGGKILTGSVEANALKANSLTLGQINTDTQADILNSKVVVGGRNLLRRTASSFTYAINTTSYGTHHLYSTGTTDTAYDGPKLAELGLAVDDEVTLSFDWSTSANGSNAIRYGTFRAEMYGVKADGTNGYTTMFGSVVTMSATNNAGHYSQKVKLTSLTVNTLRMVLRVDNSCLTFAVSNVKLEKGNKATDWSPAPEDVDDNLASSVDNINGQIEKVEGSVNTLTTDVTGHTERLDAAEDALKTVKALVDNLADVTSWLTFTSETGLMIGDNTGSTYFYTQQKGSFMSFNQMAPSGSQELMRLSGTDGVKAPKVTAEDVVANTLSSDWSITLDGDVFTIDYIG